MAVAKVKIAHVNMMADSVIANLPIEGLRAVLRGMLSNQPNCTPTFENQAKKYIHETAARYTCQDMRTAANPEHTSASLDRIQKRVCCMIGCGLCYESLPLLQGAVEQISQIRLPSENDTNHRDSLSNSIAAIDGTIVQTITAVQKTLFVSTGTRELSKTEAESLSELLQALRACEAIWKGENQTFLLDRALQATMDLLNPSPSFSKALETDGLLIKKPQPIKETFDLNGLTLPRIFTGLWQLSSPAWGSASQPKIMEQFSRYVSHGLTAFDMADHYGDAEIIFVSFLL